MEKRVVFRSAWLPYALLAPQIAVTIVFFFWPAAQAFWYSFQIQETSEQSPWRPILWPFRASVPLAALLFMIQGVSESLKCWYQIRFGREFEHREKLEI